MYLFYYFQLAADERWKNVQKYSLISWTNIRTCSHTSHISMTV